MINPIRADIGRKVIWRTSGKAREGVITQIDQRYVFVRFEKEDNSTVMTRDELEWSEVGSRS